MTASVVYPSGLTTPHGRYHIRKGDIPEVSLQSFNDQIVLWLMGGRSMAEKFARPESVQIKSIKGLIAPWQTIDEQGATQDGVTFVDALYGPTEIVIELELFAATPKRLRRLRRHVYEALDVHEQSEFGWMTHEMGYWWAPVRWWKTPDNQESGPQQCTQTLTLQLRGDSGFYQSFPDIDTFEFEYADMVDEFDIEYPDDLGPMWPQYYTGSGTGYHFVDNGLARWKDDPDRVFFTGSRRVLCGPYKDFEAASDDVEVSFVVDNTPEFTVGTGAANGAWARMGRNPDGTWDGSGIRARIGWGYVRISVFKAFQEVHYWQEFELFPPLAGETFTLKCEGRRFTFYRTNFLGDVTVIAHTETGSDLSFMDADHRGVGFDMQAGGALITQATPARVRRVLVDGVVLDEFSIDYADGLGVDWPLRYTGLNDAYVHTAGGSARWVDNAGTNTQEVVNGPYRDFETETNNQVVSMILGAKPEWSAPETGSNDLWARMGRNADGSWNGTGVRARIQLGGVMITAFVDFVEVWQRYKNILGLVPNIGEKWTLVAGYEGNPRMFKIARGGSTMLEYKEQGTQSQLGAAFRGIGFGVRAAGALVTQATPATVRRVAAGDNAEVTQSGFLTRQNAGDQKTYDSYTLYGPAKLIKIANGPGSTDMIEFGPLAVGEIVHIVTDPRKTAVYDYTDRTGAINNVPLTPGQNPSDQMFRRMNGRFTSDCAIPKKEPGMRVEKYMVACSIVGGDADSKIDSALTPLRRSPQ